MEKQPKLGRLLVAGAIALLLMQVINAVGPRLSPAYDSAAAEAIPTINGDQLMQQVAEAKTPTLVFIYASWCPYCRKQKPVMEQLARDYEGRLKILPISIDEDPGKLAAYLAKRPSPLETMRVREEDYLPLRRVIAKTGSGFTGAIPHSVILGPDGKLIDEAAGFVDYRNFKSGLDQLL